MRVITGSARGRKLKTLDGLDTRPTTEMVKEAVFSAIQFQVPYAHMLDVFAGSGQMGIEALSRGARRVVFLDNSRQAQEIIKDNLMATGLMKQAKVIADDAKIFLSHAPAEEYDIIFLDPPYNKGFGAELLPLLGKPLTQNGIVVFEHSRDEQLPEQSGILKKKKSYRYGKTMITTFVKDVEETV